VEHCVVAMVTKTLASRISPKLRRVAPAPEG